MEKLPYRDLLIGENDTPEWRRGQFVLDISTGIGNESLKNVVIEMPEVKERNHVNQNGDKSFIEFEKQETIIKCGFQAEGMRSHGCGISSLHMVLSVLGSDRYLSRIPTVGALALEALSHHKNDLVDQMGNLHIGSPVFNFRTGWYHDALVYVAKKTAGIEAFRSENIESLESMAMKVSEIKARKTDRVLIIMSVSNKFWRTMAEPSSVATHLVVVNGFAFSENDRLSSIRVTDPFVGGEPRVDYWIDVNDRIRSAFTGRAMFFYRNEKE